MGKYVRNNAWNNGGDFTNQDLLWYAKGVQAMMSRALSDPTSWWFFAAIHGEYVNPKTVWYVNPPQFPDWGFIQGPPGVPTSPLPIQGTQDLYWNQCQHGSWYFLPWHRGYLLALEAQLRADIVALGGPATWALPYWNYFGGDGGSQGAIPPAFSQQSLNGAPNPLYVAMRYGPGGNADIYVPTPAWEASHAGAPAPGDGDVTDDCLGDDLYTGADPRTPLPGFGGPVTPFSHPGDDTPHGNMESNPHDLVHVYVGGQPGHSSSYGLMADPGIAALDPIFYLHHCNIDRMWAIWNGSGNANPTDPDWLNGPSRQFVMPWPGTTPWYYSPMQVANFNDLDYTYQELAAAAAAAPNPLAMRLTALGATEAAKRVGSGRAIMRLSEPPELLGASAGSVLVEGTGAHAVNIRIDSGVRRKVATSLAAVSEAALPDRVYLKLENVRGAFDATVLGIHINLSDNAAPEQRRASLAGTVALFGVRRASVADGEHGGGGLSFVVDITRFVDAMHASKAFDVGSIQVSVLPYRELPTAEKITVGRISIYREGQ
jgi:tyrosinase